MTTNETYEQRWERREAALRQRIADIPSRFTNEALYEPRPVATVMKEAVQESTRLALFEKLARKAAKRAVAEWFTGQFGRFDEEINDVTQDLWVWYLERPSIAKTFADLPPHGIQHLCYKQALAILSENRFDQNVFEALAIYSSDSVKDVLKGKSTNKFLKLILPAAMDAINPDYQQAISSRYEEGVIPEQDSPEIHRLKNAHKSLTAEVNRLYVTAAEEPEGTGSKNAVFPQTRRPKGGHGDPTADMAVQLIERPYEAESGTDIRPHLYEVTPIREVVGGAKATPAYALSSGARFRPTGEAAAILPRFPQLIEPFLAKTQEELCSTT